MLLMLVCLSLVAVADEQRAHAPWEIVSCDRRGMSKWHVQYQDFNSSPIIIDHSIALGITCLRFWSNEEEDGHFLHSNQNPESFHSVITD